MGTWNATCMATNLSIPEGAPVVAFLLVQHEFYDRKRPMEMATETTAFWRPLSLPIRGTYDGVGFIRDVEETDAAAYSMSLLKSRLVEREKGEGPSDRAVRREDLDFEMLGEWLHGDRLVVANPFAAYGEEYAPELAVAMTLVQAPVFEKLLFLGPESRINRGRPGLSERRDFIDSWFADAREKGVAHAMSFCEPGSHRIKNGADKVWKDLANALILDPGFDEALLEDEKPFGRVDLEWLADRRRRLTPILEEWCRLAQFEATIESLRRHWQPMTGMGSPHEDLEGHATLAAIMREAIAERRAAFDLDDDCVATPA